MPVGVSRLPRVGFALQVQYPEHVLLNLSTGTWHCHCKQVTSHDWSAARPELRTLAHLLPTQYRVAGTWPLSPTKTKVASGYSAAYSWNRTSFLPASAPKKELVADFWSSCTLRGRPRAGLGAEQDAVKLASAHRLHP